MTTAPKRGRTAARDGLVDRFAAYPERVANAARAASPIPGEWTPEQVVRHLIAVETIVHQARLVDVAVHLEDLDEGLPSRADPEGGGMTQARALPERLVHARRRRGVAGEGVQVSANEHEAHPGPSQGVGKRGRAATVIDPRLEGVQEPNGLTRHEGYLAARHPRALRHSLDRLVDGPSPGLLAEA